MPEMNRCPCILKFEITEPPAVLRAFRSFPEFKRGAQLPDGEEYIWMEPQTRNGHTTLEPVVSVRVSGHTLWIECQSRQAFLAVQMLIDPLIGKYLKPGSAVIPAVQHANLNGTTELMH